MISQLKHLPFMPRHCAYICIHTYTYITHATKPPMYDYDPTNPIGHPPFLITRLPSLYILLSLLSLSTLQINKTEFYTYLQQF